MQWKYTVLIVMVNTPLFRLEIVFFLNTNKKNKIIRRYLYKIKIFWIPDPVKVKLKSIFSYGRNYKNYSLFYLNLKYKKIKIK
jgi:hypothetical protein